MARYARRNRGVADHLAAKALGIGIGELRARIRNHDLEAVYARSAELRLMEIENQRWRVLVKALSR